MATLGSPMLDCFRNGSIIQLRSKPAEQNRCLRLLANKEVDSYGRPGFFAGPWVPRMRVWGKWTNGLYYKGQVSSVDWEKVHISFDDGDKISHDINDPTAVVNDQDPDVMAVQVGTRVIASWPRRTRYYAGIVVDVDRSSKQNPTYDIHFDDGDKGKRKLKELRPLVSVSFNSTIATPSSKFAPGTRVWSRSHDGKFYRGAVSHCDGFNVHVNMDTGSPVTHSVKEEDAIVMDMLLAPHQVSRGSNVLAIWPGGNHAVPSQVMDINYNNSAPSYYVKYKSGDQAWANLEQLRILPYGRDFAVGARVWCRWQPEYRKFFLGYVTKLDNQIHVRLDDGRVQAHDYSEQYVAVIPEVVPPCGIIKKNSYVIAYRDQQHFRSGFVVEVDARNPSQPRFEIKFDDCNDRTWVFVDQLRFVYGLDQQNESQFMVHHLGGTLVSLSNVKYPDLYLGVDGNKVKGKPLDESCHFVLSETEDHYVKLESKIKPKCCIRANGKGVQQPLDATQQGGWTNFEVKLIFSPYFQTYKADHTPAPTPPQPYPPGPYPAPAPVQPGYNPSYPGGPQPPPVPQPSYPGYPPPHGGHHPHHPPHPHHPHHHGHPPPPGAHYPPTGHHPPPPGVHYPPTGHHPPPPGAHYPPTGPSPPGPYGNYPGYSG